MLNIQTIKSRNKNPCLTTFAQAAKLLLCSSAIACLSCAMTAQAQNKPAKANTAKQTEPPKAMARWANLQEFVKLMAAKHDFDEARLLTLFEKATYSETARQLVRPAPSDKPKNWEAYRARFVENKRIEAGINFWNENEATLLKAEREFGVPPEIIVGLIGVETIYGKMTGNFRLIDVLTTLAFDYPETPNQALRSQFFKDELEQFLLMARESKQDPLVYRGSFAGALGLPQFMPGSVRRFAVDYDQDGKLNLYGSSADAIGSVANYLAKHGWQSKQLIAAPASLLINKSDASQLAKLKEVLNQGLKASYTLEQLKPIASSAVNGLPENQLYGLIDLQNGYNPEEYWLATANFFAITYYNRSYFYAMSVLDLGTVIKSTRESRIAQGQIEKITNK